MRIPPVSSDAEYKTHWQTAARYLNATYRRVTVEKGASDLARLCCMSWDPGLRYNPDALLFPGYREARLLQTLVRKLLTMRHGEPDTTRNVVAYTLGGRVAGGFSDEVCVLDYFEPLVRATTQHPDRQWRKFQKQLERGKKRPIKDTRLIVQRAKANADRYQNGQHAPLPLSDTSNAQRLVTPYGDDLRHCDPWKKRMCSPLRSLLPPCCHWAAVACTSEQNRGFEFPILLDALA